jgi:phasin family protein
MAANPGERTSGERNPNAAAQDATQTAREAARKGARQAERIAEATANVNNQAARTGANIMERHAETAHHVIQSGAEMAAMLTARSADQWSRALGFSGDEAQTAVRLSTDNVSAILHSGAAMAEVGQDMAVEWINFSREHMEQNLERLDHLIRSRSPHDLLDLQSAIMKSNLERLLGYTRRVAEKSMRVADEVTRKFTENADQASRTA